MAKVNFIVSDSDEKIIHDIAIRATNLTNGALDFLTCSMDLSACHNANSLNLQKLLTLPDADFIHDVLGINRHLDRENGELKDCFWPRCGGIA